MLNTIRLRDLTDAKGVIDLPEKLVHAAFNLLLIGCATNDGSWAQGSGNWAYNKCDDIIRTCALEKLNISEFLSVLCAAAKVHGNLYITSKGNGYMTIASSNTDASDRLMRIVTDDELRSSAHDIYDLCVDYGSEILELHYYTFSSLCTHILNTLYPFFNEYRPEKIFVELKEYLQAINAPRALERYDNAIKQLNKKYTFK